MFLATPILADIFDSGKNFLVRFLGGRYRAQPSFLSPLIEAELFWHDKFRVQFLVILLRELTECKTNPMTDQLVRKCSRNTGQNKSPGRVLENAVVAHPYEILNVLRIRLGGLCFSEREIADPPSQLDYFF